MDFKTAKLKMNPYNMSPNKFQFPVTYDFCIKTVCATTTNLQNHLSAICTAFKHQPPHITSDSSHSVTLPLMLSNFTSNSGSRYEPVVGSCEHGNEFSSSIKAGNSFSS
jgi:hypothetical protein